MKTELLKYMLKRFDKTTSSNTNKEKHIITISREYGCNANLIAKLLQKGLSNKGKKWRIINKEILHEAAEELNISPHYLDSISSSKNKGFFVDIAKGFSERFYTNNKTIRNTISRVIQRFANEGNIIFVGRAAAAVTSGTHNTIHIKLIAPIENRASLLLEKENSSLDHITDIIKEMDKKREQLIMYYSKERSPQELFDICFNKRNLSDKDIVELIISTMKAKKMI